MTNSDALRPRRISVALSFLCLVALPGFAAEVQVFKDIAYKAGDGLSAYERERSKLDLYVPQGVRNYPVVAWFHGGGLTGGDKARADHVEIATSLAARGVGVASVNYRLSPRANFPAYVDDAAASVAWLLEHTEDYGGDDRKVFVSGHSAGAYLVAMIGVDPQYLAAYDHDLDEIAGMIPISGQMVTHETVRAERGLPAARPIIDAAAPVFHVDSSAPPFLAIAGSEDLPARSAENRYFVEALKAVEHQDATFIEFEGRNHGTIVSRIPEAGDPVAQAMVEFIERHSR
jgi:acetyl esterase/lipase